MTSMMLLVDRLKFLYLSWSANFPLHEKHDFSFLDLLTELTFVPRIIHVHGVHYLENQATTVQIIQAA